LSAIAIKLRICALRPASSREKIQVFHHNFYHNQGRLPKKDPGIVPPPPKGAPAAVQKNKSSSDLFSSIGFNRDSSELARARPSRHPREVLFGGRHVGTELQVLLKKRLTFFGGIFARTRISKGESFFSRLLKIFHPAFQAYYRISSLGMPQRRGEAPGTSNWMTILYTMKIVPPPPKGAPAAVQKNKSSSDLFLSIGFNRDSSELARERPGVASRRRREAGGTISDFILSTCQALIFSATASEGRPIV